MRERLRYGLQLAVRSPVFALPWIVCWAVSAFLSFASLNVIDPFDAIDYWFFARLYVLIGVAAGALSWFLARLLTLQRISIALVLMIILPPYWFVLVLSVANNFIVAIGVTLMFCMITCLCLLVAP